MTGIPLLGEIHKGWGTGTPEEGEFYEMLPRENRRFSEKENIILEFFFNTNTREIRISDLISIHSEHLLSLMRISSKETYRFIIIGNFPPRPEEIPEFTAIWRGISAQPTTTTITPNPQEDTFRIGNFPRNGSANIRKFFKVPAAWRMLPIGWLVGLHDVLLTGNSFANRFYSVVGGSGGTELSLPANRGGLRHKTLFAYKVSTHSLQLCPGGRVPGGGLDGWMDG